MEKILPISLKLNFTPNTLGCYGLKDVAIDPTRICTDTLQRSANDKNAVIRDRLQRT